MSQVDTSITQSACGLPTSSQDVFHESSTPPPELIDASSSPSLVGQPVESVGAAATEIDNVGAGRVSTSLNKAVPDTLPAVVYLDPCDTSELIRAVEEGVFQIVQHNVDVPSASVSTIPSTNSHSMITRSKVGTFKPKLYALECKQVHEVPGNVHEALQHTHWKEAVQ
ncbi:hypothetical protein V6N11_055299 [Hibiscus sabdariffa]|uniref:Uncharacterized protein n=2 Tax=Hibiscus sabdariffa TaxID=183260 RepID=A0ABR2BQK3_9ROSI